MLEKMKLYLKGQKIHFRDTKLVARVIYARIWCLVILAFLGLCWYLQKGNEETWIFALKGVFQINPYFLFAWLVCMPITFGLAIQVAYEKLFPDRFRRLKHRENLARIIVENGYYEVEKKESVQYVQLPFGRKEKEQIKFFPSVFYRMHKGKVYVYVEHAMGRLQEPLLNLHKKLELGLFCEMLDEEQYESYKEYVLLYDMICNRVNIDEVYVEDGKLLLMQNRWWDFDSLPHALIVGGTGGGKTYFILTLIEALLKSGATVSVLDPKRADLSDLAEIMPNVYFLIDDMIAELERFYIDMMNRVDEIKQMPTYKTGVNYRYVGLEPRFLVFDEYVAFMEMVGRRREEVLTYMRQIAMLGRQVGHFLILACQRPDAKYFADGMRDQFNMRMALGRNSELGYGMVFGSENKKQFFNKRIKGRGYIDLGGTVITEFYSPFVPKEYDFLRNIREMDLLPTVKLDVEKEVIEVAKQDWE